MQQHEARAALIRINTVPDDGMIWEENMCLTLVGSRPAGRQAISPGSKTLYGPPERWGGIRT
jgi:hypothetical protein